MSRPDLARRYWDAYETSVGPPEGSAARNLERIRARIDAGDRVEPASRSRRRSPRAAAGVLLWGKAVAASVGLGVAALLSVKLVIVAGSVVVGDDRTEAPGPAPAPEATPSTGRAPEVPAVSPAVEPAVAPVPAEAAPTSVVPPSAVPEPRLAPTARAPARATIDALRVELELMERARAVLVRDGEGDGATLLRLLDEHARRFPSGALAEEREAWRAVAACRLGHDDAQARARRFGREHAGSPQASRVQRECTHPKSVRSSDG